MLSFLNSSFIDPSLDIVSVKYIGTALGLGFPLSIKDMLSRRDTVRVVKYGICLCTYTDGTPVKDLGNAWLERVFSDPLGIAKYFRKMSGGRKIVEWKVFPYKGDIMTLAEKKVLEKKAQDANDVWLEVIPTWDKALVNGIPVDTVDHVIFVIDLDYARAGVTANPHIFLASNDIRPNNICHEMGHLFGLEHASQAEYNDYGDSYCVMGGLGPAGWNATEFQNSRLIMSTGTDSHGGTGPGICTPYLRKLEWIDNINTNHIYLSENGALSGDITGSFYANQGGLPFGSTKRIALVIDVPPPSSASAYTYSEYWIEYRIPQGFDKQFGPSLLLREVVSSHSYYLYMAPAVIGGKLRLPKLKYIVKITDIDSASQQISYAFEKVE